MFNNREDAGKQLAEQLLPYRSDLTIVLAIPRGGVPVAFEVASRLQAQFSLIICRKLPFPHNPEAGFGAVAEDGSTIIMPGPSAYIPKDNIEAVIEDQKKEIARRIKILRGGQPFPNLHGRIVILIDDGIAMGSTMRAAIKLCTKHNPEKLVVGSPVSSPEVAHFLEQKEEVDNVIILERPQYFRAVAQVYEEWCDVPDHEVLDIMNLGDKKPSN